MNNIDEEIDLKSPTYAAFNNESIGLERVRQEINISEENIKGSSDNKFELSKHAQKNIRKCPICGIPKRNMSQHMRIHLAPEERQWFACTHCDKKYRSKPVLRHHHETNHIDPRSTDAQRNMHKCSICSYQTRNMSYFRRHQKIHLARENRQLFACAHCSRKYTTKRNLGRHIEDYHIDSRSNDAQKDIRKCSICGYQTRNVTQFGRHQIIHLAPEERQLFACTFCEKKYRDKYWLKYHIQKKHHDSRSKKEQKKIYRCSLCSYQTPRKFRFETHNNIHLPPEERPMFACTQCDKKYTSNKGLQDHVKREHSRLEESLKKFRCSTCDYQTLRMANLRRHETIHLAPTERQLFCCTHCDRKFRAKVYLKRHLEHHIGSRNADCIPPIEEVILDSLKIEINDHALLSDEFKNDECPAMTNEVKSDDFIKTEPEDVVLSLNKDTHDDFKYSECLSETNEVKSEPDDVAPVLNIAINTENLFVTQKVKLEDIIKMEPDDVAPVLNQDMYDDFKIAECSSTNEVKSEDFIKTEPDYVAPSPEENKNMHDDFKNSENVSVTQRVKLEDFIKMEPDDGVPLLNEGANK
ncbi:oocyte zinc finger protein XlCOF6-like isoform X3 [Sitophilus oryzae]|uniref:Oocyte zinc finger protein XlCOF6-like isoform X3 n=1 Tax=Sitophilus oryzae TaxID=7048 RepID=A0A6J2XQ08_SITOR|nr:oocyte zinc finger protein XlCOF6-like isoform X3 [Sitophilus oryzae]